MNMRNKLFLIAVACVAFYACSDNWTLQPSTNVYGRVTCDGKAVEGVLLCDGYKYVSTDSRGRYELSSSKSEQTVFICVPSGYSAVCEDGNPVPSFFRSISADSTVVDRCDFTLKKQDQSRYGVIFFPDAHLCNDEPRKHDLVLFDTLAMPLYRRLHDSLACHGPVLTVELGDLSHDRYWYSNAFNLTDAFEHLKHNGISAPLLGVTGNHDHDPALVCTDTPDGDFAAQSIFRRLFGPDRYSMNIGEDHWIFMDNISYLNTEDKSDYLGVAGRRDYDVTFRPEQMAWLEEDISHLASGTHVVMCLHAPLFGKVPEHYPLSQLHSIDSLLASRDCRMDVFAGHIHRMEQSVNDDFPSITVHALSAVSGNMWECYPADHVVGLDGTEGSLSYVDVCGRDMRMYSASYNGSNPYFRIYDMNTLCDEWKSDPDKRWIRNQVREQVDYTDSRYSNMIVVNFWWRMPGYSLEIYEDGRPLAVKPAPFTVDPEALYQSFNFRRKSYEGKNISLASKELTMASLYCTRATKPHSTILVRALRPDGSTLAEQTLQR